MTPIEAVGIPLLRPHDFVDKADQVKSSGEADPFAEILSRATSGVNQSLKSAAAAGEAFAAGASDDIHGTMLALSKADIQLRLIGNAKNKVIDAFYELWRMQA